MKTIGSHKDFRTMNVNIPHICRIWDVSKNSCISKSTQFERLPLKNRHRREMKKAKSVNFVMNDDTCRSNRQIQ